MPTIINLQKAAELLGVHCTTLKRWCVARKVPHIKYPTGACRFDVDELMQWQRSKKIAPANETQNETQKFQTLAQIRRELYEQHGIKKRT